MMNITERRKKKESKVLMTIKNNNEKKIEIALDKIAFCLALIAEYIYEATKRAIGPGSWTYYFF